MARKTPDPELIGPVQPEPEPAPEFVVFESRNPEPSPFTVMGIEPTRSFADGRLEWAVPAESVELFEQNHFVGLSRVVRKRVED